MRKKLSPMSPLNRYAKNQSGFDEFESITGSRYKRSVQEIEEMTKWQWTAKVMLSPITRLEDVPRPWGWITATSFAFWQWMTADAFRALILIVIAANIWDYIFGVWAAKHRGKWDSRLAHAGAVGKVMGLVMLSLLHAVEEYITHFAPDSWPLPEAHGMVAVVAGVGLILVDLQSIENHRKQLGLRPIPGISWVFDILEKYSHKKKEKP